MLEVRLQLSSRENRPAACCRCEHPGRVAGGVVATVIMSGGDEKRSVVKVGARIWEMKTASRDSYISQYTGWGSLKVHRMIKHITG